MSEHDREPEYRPVIIQRNGRFCIYLAELEIAGVGDTPDQAYTEYQARLKETLLRAKEWGLGAHCLEPYPPRGGRRGRDELILFGAKAFIAVSVTIFLVVAFLPNIKAAYCKVSGGESAICARR